MADTLCIRAAWQDDGPSQRLVPTPARPSDTGRTIGYHGNLPDGDIFVARLLLRNAVKEGLLDMGANIAIYHMTMDSRGI